MLGGIYSNPNDLAFAIVLALPFALAFMVTTKSAFAKVAWLGGMLIMLFTIFMTASRAGFIDLCISGAVTLYILRHQGQTPVAAGRNGFGGGADCGHGGRQTLRPL